ncbi:MAG: GIN domain-containing protein [Leadbetterella sp.]
MKKQFLFVTLLLITNFVYSQKKPLEGSGKRVKISYDFRNFDKLNIADFDGEIHVKIGPSYSILVQIDDNLAPKLVCKVDAEKSELSLYLKDNKNGSAYLENTNIKIKITMPEASVIRHRGNTNVKVEGIMGRYFRYEHQGNGSSDLGGNIDELDIDKIGNGSIDAVKLKTLTAKVKSIGNGNVKVNARMKLQANGTGNGSVIQVGQGEISSMSGIVGNGEVKKLY